jgi:hypothetical protein
MEVAKKAKNKTAFRDRRRQTGLPDFFLVKNIKTGKNIPKDHKICIPNGHKIFSIAVKWSKIIPRFSIARPDPSKFTQNWYFWFENQPSGNPGDKALTITKKISLFL